MPSEKLNRRDEQDGREIMDMIDARDKEPDVKRRDQAWLDCIRDSGIHGQ